MSDDAVDTRRRRFLTGTTVVIGGIGAAFTAVPFVSSFQPSARAKRATTAKDGDGRLPLSSWPTKLADKPAVRASAADRTAPAVAHTPLRYFIFASLCYIEV